MSLVLGPLASGMLALLPGAMLPEPSVATADAGTVEVAAGWVGEPIVETPAERTAPGFADVVRQQQDADRAQQVRIEQRVIIRVSPGPLSRPGPPMLRDPRRGLFEDFPERSGPRFIERRMGQCLPVSGIAGVQADGPSRLILFMRDQRIVSAALEKGCNARDYYSGFLVERTSDGMICAARDKLLSRNGANCAVNKLHQLIEIDPDE